MTKKIVSKCVACALLLASFFPALSAAAGERKYLVLLADYGKSGPGPDIVETLRKNSELRLVIPWPSSLKPSESVKALAAERRIEAALRLDPEPVLPLIANVKLDSPLEIEFSWPEDVWDIIVRGQVESNQNAIPLGKGMYLRSGALSQALVPGLKKLGLRWVNYTGPGGMTGISVDDSMLLLAAQPAPSRNAAECIAWVRSRQEPVVVLTPVEDNVFSAEFLSELASLLRQDHDVRLATAEQLLRESRQRPELASPGTVPDPDAAAWLASPIAWYQLFVARRAVEDYKNSGEAKLKVLQRLKDEMYRLYDHELLLRLAQNTDPAAEKAFEDGIAAIYGTLENPAAPPRGLDLSVSTAAAENVPFSLEASTSSLRIVNFAPAGSAVLANFTVTLGDDHVRYRVELATTAGSPECVDVYMDLNNQEGAGITRFLPGVDAFMETNDAWEYALRFENGGVSLYRSGRFEPTLVGSFKPEGAYEVAIPRRVLRGNPVQCGYQVVVEKKGTSGLEVCDFISQEETSRKRILDQFPVQLPAVRAGGSRSRIE